MSNIREVAKAAGVSTATVSRVINHNTEGKMTAETRERVWEAIAKLNYKAPARFIQKKKPFKNRGKASTILKIGCVISTERDKYSDPYYLKILSAIEDRAHKNNCMVPLVVTSRELEESTSLDQIFTFPLSGIILMNSLDDKIYSYIRAHVPAIVGVDTSHKEIDNIEYDHYLASSLAVDTFYAKGYRDIGFIGAAPDELGLENSRRFKGYFSSMHAHGLTIRKETCVNCHWQEKECYEIIQKLFHEHALPEAFLVASDLMAMAVLRTLFDLGIQVPEQIAVMGITNIEMSRFSNPPLTTIDIPASHMGTLAFDTLLQRIQGYDMLPRRISLPLNVLLRSSI